MSNVREEMLTDQEREFAAEVERVYYSNELRELAKKLDPIEPARTRAVLAIKVAQYGLGR